MSSPVADKLALYTSLFRARTDVYAVRWENTRTGANGWMPAVAGGWRKGMDRKAAAHLPLTAEVVAAHLVGDVFMGLYPLLAGNTCHFLVADFDGPAAMLDALAYVKAARASSVPAALEISQSGRGAHVWVFFTDAVPATIARSVGMVLVHEAMVLRGSMDLRSYDRWLHQGIDMHLALIAKRVGRWKVSPGTGARRGRSCLTEARTYQGPSRRRAV